MAGIDWTRTTSAVPNVHHLLLGKSYWSTTFSENEPFQREGIVRYTLLNRNVPILVDEMSSHSKYAYLSSGHAVCYCDSECILLGDCCSDYSFVCPRNKSIHCRPHRQLSAVACSVSDWSSWSQCLETEENSAHCNLGERTRFRRVQTEATFGGGECPHLKEVAACFRSCGSYGGKSRAYHVQKKKKYWKFSLNMWVSAPSTALILPYRLALARIDIVRNNIYWDLPKVIKRRTNFQSYCIVYEINWINKNCADDFAVKKLNVGRRICAECQPEAQMHRKDQRCASDLDEGQFGFWKLIGPKSCTGIWKHLIRIDDCICSTAKLSSTDHTNVLLV